MGTGLKSVDHCFSNLNHLASCKNVELARAQIQLFSQAPIYEVKKSVEFGFIPGAVGSIWISGLILLESP